MSSSLRWTEHDTMKLIRLYKSYEFLWDRNSELYKNIVARNQAYDAIVSDMDIPGLSPLDVRCKIKNLRSSYYQELRKIASCRMRNKILKPLKWFTAFKSIMAHIDPPDKTPKLPESHSESEEYEEEEAQLSELFVEEQSSNSDAYVVSIKQEFLDEMDNLCDKSMPPTICDYLEPVIEPKRHKPAVTQIRPHETNKPEEETMPHIKINKNIDEFQMFANNIAQQLRKIPLSRALSLQVEVQRMIAKERIEMIKKQAESKNQEEDST